MALTLLVLGTNYLEFDWFCPQHGTSVLEGLKEVLTRKKKVDQVFFIIASRRGVIGVCFVLFLFIQTTYLD